MTQRINYGIDPGERSLAVAAIRATDDDVPVAVEALSLVLHDGGVAEEKTTTSRLAVRGTKRRDRRRLRRRRTRRSDIKQVLAENDFPIEADKTMAAKVNKHFGELANHAGFPFFARVALLEPIKDKELARHLFAVSIRHIDRHRGWRNPWTRFPTMLKTVREGSPESASPSTVPAEAGLHMTETSKLWNEAVAIALASREPRTLGECGALAIENASGVRPTDHARQLAMGDKQKATLDNTNARIKKAKTPEDLAPLARCFALPIRPMQHDLLYEVLLCASIQGFGDVEPIAETLLLQERPGSNADVVGECAIYDGNSRPLEKRAPESLPSVQEFVVRQFIANLRIEQAGELRRLTADEADALSTHLLDLNDRQEASIRALEAVLMEHSEEKLRIKRGRDAKHTDDEEAVYAGKPPIDRTNEQVHKMQRQAPSFYLWWKAASRDERELLISAFDSVACTDEAEAFADHLVADGVINADELESLIDKLPDGRSAYSQRAIAEMLPHLRDGRDLFEARQQAFDLPNDWAPRGAQWGRDKMRMNHPVLQVARSQLAPILSAFDREVGLPTSVRIEASRQALRLRKPNPVRDSAHKEREARNRAARENAAAAGLKGRGAVRKMRIIADQNQQCAYQLACSGGDLDPHKTEIDHIVPASTGANNSRANLVAVCEACNQLKGNRPLGAIIDEAQMTEIIKRVKSWNFKIIDKRLEKAMLARIKTREPEKIDERSVTTTAQTATELRGMIRDRYEQLGVDMTSDSVMAALVGEARYSAGLNEVLEGSRAGGRFKSRLDHRNHLVDAVVAACVNQKVMPILEARASLREFAGLNRGAQRRAKLKAEANGYVGKGEYFEKWLQGLTDLGVQLRELFDRDTDPNEFTPGQNGAVGPLDFDAVVPRRPLRLKAYGGALHEDTAHPLRFKSIGEEWTRDDLALIADEELSVGLVSLAAESRNRLPGDEERQIEVNGFKLGPDHRVPLVHASSAISTRDASFIAGDVHHVRIYVIETKKGLELAFVPVYSFDVVQAIADARDNSYPSDRRATSVPLRPECASYRSAPTASAREISKAARQGESTQIVAWFAPGDELWLDDPMIVKSIPVSAMPDEWKHEHRWTYSGLSGSYLIVKPRVLSPELPRIDGAEVTAPKCRVNLSDMQGHVTIVRRSPLGRPTTVMRLADFVT